MEGFVKISLSAYIRPLWRCQWSKSEFNSEGDDPLRCCESDITSGSAACHGEILRRILLLPVNNKSVKTYLLSQFLSPFIVCCIPAKNAKSLIKELSKYFTQKIFFNKSFQQFSMSRWRWSKDGKYLTILNNSRRFSKLFLQHSLRLFGSPVSHYLSPLLWGSVSVPMTAAPCHPGGGCQSSIRCLAPAQVTAHITQIT